MSLRRILPALVAGAALVAAACGDDLPTGTNSGDQPSVQEVDELVSELFGDLADLFAIDLGGSPSVSAPLAPGLSLSLASIPIDETVRESGTCEGGGSVSVSGSIKGNVDDTSFEGDLHLDVTESIEDCVVIGETTTFTVNGAPHIRMVGDFDFSQTSISADFTIQGGFKFTTDDDRSGSCAISVNVDVSITQEGAVSQSVSGSACNRSVAEI